MADNPAVSVLLPVRNGGEWLEAAVLGILDQTFPDLELVLVDDGSDDGMAERWKDSDPRVRYVRSDRNRGLVHALNWGLSLCRAPLVARQDADDVSTVTRLEAQVAFMDASPEVAACGSHFWTIDRWGSLTGAHRRPVTCREVTDFMVAEGCPLCHGSVMVRREAVTRLGGYPAVPHAEDWALWCEMAVAGLGIANVDEWLYYHRNHPGKVSAVHAREQADNTAAVRRRFLERFLGRA